MSSSSHTSEAQHERAERKAPSSREPTSAQPEAPTGMGKPADEEEEAVNPGDPGPPILRRDDA
jgi:hypothetical protein